MPSTDNQINLTRERTPNALCGVRSHLNQSSCSGFVYLLHFHPRYKHARHYLGYTKHLATRIEEHRCGTGARLTQVAVANGITLELVRTWRGNRKLERMLKRQKNAPLLCPLCNPFAYRRAVNSDSP